MQAQTDTEKLLQAKYPPGTDKISAIEYCIAKPYYQLRTEQATERSHQAKEHMLHVDSIVTRPASDIWWNLFQCHLDNDRTSRCTAKIYDPVSSSYEQFAHMCANEHINSETDAYARIMEAGLSGRVTPAFLGVWVMEVPVPSKSFKVWWCGLCVYQVGPATAVRRNRGSELASTYLRFYYTSEYVEPEPQLPKAWRREILAKIYEAETLLTHAGVHAEVLADGVFVRTTGLENERPDVRISSQILKESVSQDQRTHGRDFRTTDVSYRGVLDDVMHDMKCLAWDERRTDQQLKDYRKWLVQRWGESTEYRPLAEDLQKRIAYGEWGEI